MFATYQKTATLENKFRGQKALVVAAFENATTPQTLEQIIAKADAGGKYRKLLNKWAMEKAGGVRGSVLYHLRQLVDFKMVKGQGEIANGPRVTKAKAKAAKPRKPKAQTPATPISEPASQPEQTEAA